MSSATHQIQGFLVQLTLPLSLSLIYRKDGATGGLAPVLLAPVEPFSMKALAPLLQTISPDVVEQDPTFGLLMGLNWRTASL